MNFPVLCIAVAALTMLPADTTASPSARQDAAKQAVAIDPQTGRAVGAKEMSADALKALIDQKAAMIIIDVRDEAEFLKETIPGSIHVSLGDLEERLKEIPKNTILAFT